MLCTYFVNRIITYSEWKTNSDRITFISSSKLGNVRVTVSCNDVEINLNNTTDNILEILDCVETCLMGYAERRPLFYGTPIYEKMCDSIQIEMLKRTMCC